MTDQVAGHENAGHENEELRSVQCSLSVVNSHNHMNVGANA